MLLVAFNISKSLFFSFTCKKRLLSILMWVLLQVLVGLPFTHSDSRVTIYTV